MLRVLVLCTGNSARSILGEALFNHLGKGRVEAVSAGSFPKGAPHPQALATLRAHGLSDSGYSSKSWDAFTGPDAAPIDIVVTVCDNAAGETCPIFPGRAVKGHWGIADPAYVSSDKVAAAFERAWDELSARVTALLAEPIETMDPAELKPLLDRIGRMEGATPGPAHG